MGGKESFSLALYNHERAIFVQNIRDMVGSVCRRTTARQDEIEESWSLGMERYKRNSNKSYTLKGYRFCKHVVKAA